jgi:hypothetical protein
VILAALVIGAELAVACLVLAAVLLIADHWHRDILDALDRLEVLVADLLEAAGDETAGSGR